MYVTKQNLCQAAIVFTVQRIIKPTWINDRDQFLQPNAQPSVGFIRRCAVRSLFADSNQTASLRNVAYEGKSFQIINHFFPFKVSVLKRWEISDSDIRRSLVRDTDDRFVANWLTEQKLDAASADLLEVGREIYKAFFKNFKDLPTAKYKVEHWDAGWWQIKRCLVETGLEKERLARVEEIKKQLNSEIGEAALDLGMIATVDLF